MKLAVTITLFVDAALTAMTCVAAVTLIQSQKKNNKS